MVLVPVILQIVMPATAALMQITSDALMEDVL